MNEISMPETIGSSSTTLIVGDAITEMARLKAGSIDLIVSSPPYNIGKIYERDQKLSLDEYLEWQAEVIRKAKALLADTGSICWQTGNFVRNGELFPLDLHFYQIFQELGFKLRNRIIWRFNFGLNSDRRFSGRYETLLWFTKGDTYKFNLDPVRIPQIYPGKRHSSSKVGKAGQPSGNPLGKNPSDYWEFNPQRDFQDNPVWDLPNVKHNHPEKTAHPCQFPIELAERCVLAFTDAGDTVLDPFVGAGSTVIAAARNARHSIGVDKEESFIKIAQSRIQDLEQGVLKFRAPGRPIRRPKEGEKVATIPAEWTKRERDAE